MPTVLRVGPYRFFFYAGDRSEPAHVHVERDATMVQDHAVDLQRSWDDYFAD